jgi:hypothetical protein
MEWVTNSSAMRISDDSHGARELTGREAPAAGPKEARELLGRWGTPLIIFSVLGVLGPFVFAWGFIANDYPTPPTDMMGTLLPLAVMVIVFGLLASSRIVGSTAGYIDVVNLFVRRRIPIDEIADVRSDGALKIQMTSGRRIGSIAYGQSVIGEMIGYPRSKKTAVRIREFCESTRLLGDECGKIDYSVRLRTGEMLGTLCLGALLIAVTVILNQR